MTAKKKVVKFDERKVLELIERKIDGLTHDLQFIIKQIDQLQERNGFVPRVEDMEDEDEEESSEESSEDFISKMGLKIGMTVKGDDVDLSGRYEIKAISQQNVLLKSLHGDRGNFCFWVPASRVEPLPTKNKPKKKEIKVGSQVGYDDESWEVKWIGWYNDDEVVLLTSIEDCGIDDMLVLMDNLK